MKEVRTLGITITTYDIACCPHNAREMKLDDVQHFQNGGNFFGLHLTIGCK